MPTTITLLGLGHLAGVLGRLHAAALVAPEAPHRCCRGSPAAAASRAAVPAGPRPALEVLSRLFLVNGQPYARRTVRAAKPKNR